MTLFRDLYYVHEMNLNVLGMWLEAFLFRLNMFTNRSNYACYTAGMHPADMYITKYDMYPTDVRSRDFIVKRIAATGGIF